MTKAYDEIMERIGLLSANERVQLRDYLKSLTAIDPAQGALPLGVRKEVDTTKADADKLLQIVCDVIRARGAEHAIPAMLKATPQYRSFAEKVPQVIAFAQTAFPGGARREMFERALLHNGVSLLFEDLRRMGIAITARTLMSHIHRVPAVINAAYPGYAEAGLLSKIVGM